MTSVESYIWWDENCKWPEVDMRCEVEKYFKIVFWIHDNIEKCDKHVRWTWTFGSENQCKFKFRYERDLIFFMLKWSE